VSYSHDDQRLYARVLAIGANIGVAALFLGFAAYVGGFVDPYVPIERLPALWTLPADQFLVASGLPERWGWAAVAAHGDMASLVAVALIASLALACVAAVAVHYFVQRRPLLGWIALLQVLILVYSATGILAPR